MKILISGDVQRGGQASNIKTLFSLISEPILRVTGIKPECVSSGDILKTDDWAKALESSRHLLDRYGDSGIFWIGFEFPIGFANECKRLGIPIVDFNAHPIRFCDDLFLGIKTDADVSGLEIQEDEINFAASLMKAKSEHVAGVSISSGALLLIGQTPSDRAVVLNGEIKKLENYKKDLIDLASQHTMLLFKPHPFAPQAFREPRSVLEAMVEHARIGCHRVPNVNIYKLLSEANIKTVASLSSSVLREAEYFEKTTVRFLRDLSDGYLPLSVETVMSDVLWYRIFAHHGVALKEGSKFIAHRSRNRLRQVFNSGWGYPFFSPEK